MADERWILKGCHRTEGDSYIVEEFDNEAACRKEYERMQKDHPGHLFWCEVHGSWGIGAKNSEVLGED